MFKFKFFIITFIFISFLIITSVIKNHSRVLEKKIYNLKIQVKLKEKNLSETQLDFYYLTSPDYLNKKIIEYSDDEYLSIKYSEIYFSLNQFLEEKKNTVKHVENEKKIQKK